MRRCFLCLFVVTLSLLAPAAAAPILQTSDLYVLGVALNQFPDKKSGQTIASYNWCPEEIAKVFGERSRSLHRAIKVRHVLAEKATHAGITGGFAWLRQSAAAKDLVVIYVGCHGNTDPTAGWGMETADHKTLWGHEIKAELRKLPCQVVIMIETCTSGGFARPHQKDPPLPPNVTALCACSGRQSTDNQLDMAVAEGLYGRADFNEDGVVELDELIRYIQLRYKEWWPTPKVTLGSQMPVLLKAKTLKGALPLTRVSRQLVGVVHGGVWYSALEEKRVGAKHQVHLLGWSSKPGAYFLTSSVTREFICLPSDGRPLLVNQNGRWFPARLLSQSGAKYKVHYIGYQEEEVVVKERIYYPFVGQPGENFLVLAPHGTPGAWEQVGPAGAWKGTRAGAVLNDRLFTIETNGYLYKTDLASGVWEQIGKGNFGASVFLFAIGTRLCAIDSDGNLYEVDRKTGSRVRIGPAGAWKQTHAAVVLQRRLFTLEANGSLWAADLGTGRRTRIGKPEFGNTDFLFAARDNLYTIATDGNLYRIDPKNGSWGGVGQAGEWKQTRAAVVVKGRLYTVEANGGLWETDLGSGRWKQVGKLDFGNTAFMFGAGDKVFTIEKDGTLYGVSVR